MILLWIVLLLLVILLFIKGRANEYYFKERNMPYFPPTFLIGTMGKFFSPNFLNFTVEMTQFQNEAP